jgi:hypothetical protein
VNKLLLSLAAVGLTACATAYQPESFSGGFTETQLDKNVFRVSFRGNGYTRADRAEEMALLRSADVALKNGFTHFAIVDARSRTDYSSFTTPTQSNTTGTVSSYGKTSYLNAQTRTTGGDTIIAAKPSSTNTIICFVGKPEIGTLVYDAQFVYNSLGAKYGVTGPAK